MAQSQSKELTIASIDENIEYLTKSIKTNTTLLKKFAYTMDDAVYNDIAKYNDKCKEELKEFKVYKRISLRI